MIVLTALGLRIFMKGGRFLWKKLIAPNLGLGIDLTNQGRWAVITGATDGIGKAFAMALASKGLDIVLISRSLIKLKDVETEIKERYRVNTRIVAVDLTEGQMVYSKILKATEELEVRLFIKIQRKGISILKILQSVANEFFFYHIYFQPVLGVMIIIIINMEYK